jgi:hypothetical protein
MIMGIMLAEKDKSDHLEGKWYGKCLSMVYKKMTGR